MRSGVAGSTATWRCSPQYAEHHRASKALPPIRLVFEINIGEPLAGAVAHDKAGILFFDRPGRREAASRHNSLVMPVRD
jgi:hypothetical protein